MCQSINTKTCSGDCNRCESPKIDKNAAAQRFHNRTRAVSEGEQKHASIDDISL